MGKQNSNGKGMAAQQQKGGAVVPWQAAIAEAERKFSEIAKSEGNLVSYQKEAMFALQLVGKSELLQRCAPESIRNAVINIASVGLSLNPATKHAYLVPRDGQAVLDISYMGLLHIATGSGSIITGKAVIVRANDLFEFFGPFETPLHKFNPFESREARGEIIGVYCVAKIHDGSVQVDTMSMERVHEIRERSKAYNRKGDKAPSGPWVTDPEEMILKTIIKNASKTWPKNDRISTAAHVLNEHEGLRQEFLAGQQEIMPESLKRCITDEQVAAILAECRRCGVNPEKVAKMYSAPSVEEIEADHFDEALARLKEKPDRAKTDAAA